MDISNISAYTDYVKTQNSTAAKLNSSIESTDYSTQNEEELLDACKEFEAYFLEQVFKEMEKTVDAFKDENSASNYSNSMVDFFKGQTIQSLAEQSTKSQGMGLAQSLFEQMKRNYGIGVTSPKDVVNTQETSDTDL